MKKTLEYSILASERLALFQTALDSGLRPFFCHEANVIKQLCEFEVNNKAIIWQQIRFKWKKNVAQYGSARKLVLICNWGHNYYFRNVFFLNDQETNVVLLHPHPPATPDCCCYSSFGFGFYSNVIFCCFEFWRFKFNHINGQNALAGVRIVLWVNE